MVRNYRNYFRLSGIKVLFAEDLLPFFQFCGLEGSPGQIYF